MNEDTLHAALMVKVREFQKKRDDIHKERMALHERGADTLEDVAKLRRLDLRYATVNGAIDGIFEALDIASDVAKQEESASAV